MGMIPRYRNPNFFWKYVHSHVKILRCQYCGSRISRTEEIEAAGKATIDHFIPRSKGGGNTNVRDEHRTRRHDNLVASCYLCNVEKAESTDWVIICDWRDFQLPD